MKKIAEKIEAQLKKETGLKFNVEHLGQHDGHEAFQAYVPDSHTGFPFVYLCKGDDIIKTIHGFDALDIVNNLKNKS